MVRQRETARERPADRRARLRARRHGGSAGERAKTAFLSIVSHELRTPLNTIIGQADLLADDVLSPHARAAVDAIRHAGQGLYASLNDILELAKLEGAAPAEASDLDIRTLAEGVRRICQPKAWALELDLELAVDNTIPQRLLGDAGRIRQTLLNLVGNALKFTERGGVSIAVQRLRPDLLKFSISDTGVGIDAQDQRRLFQPFEQGERFLTRRHGGLGLGLTLCKRLVEGMGGSIGVESQLGVGSTFWFTAPVSPAEAVADLAPVLCDDDALPDAAVLARIQGLRVLAADDNPLHRQSLERIFASLGLEADLVSDGLEAIEAVGRKTYDVIILDAHMPVVGGVQAARTIRTLRQKLAELAIFIVCPEGDYEEADALGLADGILRKPYTARTMGEAIGTLKAGETAEDSFDASGIVELEQTVGRPVLVDILKSFLVSAADITQRIETAMTAADSAEMERAARDLSGAASGLGLAALSLAARELSQSAREGNRAGILGQASALLELAGSTQRDLTHLYPDLATAQAA